MSPLNVTQGIQPLLDTLATIGGPLQLIIACAAVALALIALIPQAEEWRSSALGAMTVLLVGGEAVLIWFHYQLYQLAVVVDPSNGQVTGRVAVSLWVESEKLYMWALMVALLALVMRRQRAQLLPGAMLSVAVLAGASVLLGRPFTAPLPGFLGQYAGYLRAMSIGGVAADGAFQGMEATRQFYYNAWFMWVHPPLLFFSYGAFVLAFIATMQMVLKRHSSFETTAYRWARLGYLPLTVGMLLGFPWALSAWTGEAWWWSGKINMSIMMWLLYTAYLHARLYLRREHMWRVVAVLSILSFVVLVLTYIATYVIPGAHSYALAPATRVIADVAFACRGDAA
jgi:ABC-type transport system involved in cytochrome c biogenesis permease subunit